MNRPSTPQTNPLKRSKGGRTQGSEACNNPGTPRASQSSSPLLRATVRAARANVSRGDAFRTSGLVGLSLLAGLRAIASPILSMVGAHARTPQPPAPPEGLSDENDAACCALAASASCPQLVGEPRRDRSSAQGSIIASLSTLSARPSAAVSLDHRFCGGLNFCWSAGPTIAVFGSCSCVHWAGELFR
jgi:hypothetical protein